MKRLVLAGNPNVGKSVIFSLFAGKYVVVSNYPQTTIEIAKGQGKIGGKDYEIIDTPGTNTLIPSSEDEQVTTRIILEEPADAVVQVADSKNLSRALILTLQFLELELPLVLDLNLADEARLRQINIDTAKLSRRLNIPVVSTVAVEKRGFNRLTGAVLRAARSHYKFEYSVDIETALEKISELLPDMNISRRGGGILFLERNNVFEKYISRNMESDKLSRMKHIRDELSRKYLKPVERVIAQERREEIKRITGEVFRKEAPKRRRRFKKPKLTSITWGIPVLILVLWAIYWIVGYLGAQVMVDFLEGTVFGKYINPQAASIIKGLVGTNIVSDFLVGEYGLITMALTYGLAIIFPIIVAFFTVFSVMEDSGYLPRLASLLNSVFKRIGLSGKAVLPMVLGLGCSTMATMVTRILSTRKERILATFLLALGIPCSAQLGVILGMSASVSHKVTLIWFLTVLTTIFVTGYLASRLLRGQQSPDFVMEIPPMRFPKIRNIVLKVFSRVRWYLSEVIPVFIIGTALLFIADRIGLLRVLEFITAPIIKGWLGLPVKATQAFIVGFFRRDYGAAGLYNLFKQGLLTPLQVTVSLVTITLFVPCIANFLMIIKERGLRTGLAIVAFIFPFAFFVGGILKNFLLWLNIF